MSDKLELIKALRAKGASIRMIDDVAAHLDENGGYNSPVFIATVEFIIKLRNMLQSVLMQQEQTISVAEQFTGKETENVDFGAAKSGVENDGEMDDYEREKILNHIYEIEAQQENYLENNTYKQNLNVELETRGSKSKKGRDGRKGAGLLERLFKISSLNSLKNKQRQQQEMQQQESEQQSSARNAQTQQQSAQTSQVVQSVQRSSVTRMNVVRMKLMNSLRSRQRTAIEDAALQTKKQGKESLVTEKENTKEEIKPNLKELAKKSSNTLSREKRSVNEISISKVIDDAVKAAKLDKKTGATEEKSVDKGKFEKKIGDKVGPKADDKKVAQMDVKAAIQQLQNSGVTTTTTDSKTKKEIDVQVNQMQGSGGATPKLQR